MTLDALVLEAAGARQELDSRAQAELEAFEDWFDGERLLSARAAVEELIDRALARSGYELTLLAAPDGRRRLANVRKLMRLAREAEARGARGLPAFLSLVSERLGSGERTVDRESEAPVEGEGLDAVRLMTIHRAKGLEFDIVCVADLGRGPRYTYPLIRISSDGSRLGLRLGQPGSAAKLQALQYAALGAELQAEDEREERRLFYVAMTRARERLLLSGAAKLDTWAKGNRGTPIDWLAPALVPDIAEDQRSRTRSWASS